MTHLSLIIIKTLTAGDSKFTKHSHITPLWLNKSNVKWSRREPRSQRPPQGSLYPAAEALALTPRAAPRRQALAWLQEQGKENGCLVHPERSSTGRAPGGLFKWDVSCMLPHSLTAQSTLTPLPPQLQKKGSTFVRWGQYGSGDSVCCSRLGPHACKRKVAGSSPWISRFYCWGPEKGPYPQLLHTDPALKQTNSITGILPSRLCFSCYR